MLIRRILIMSTSLLVLYGVSDDTIAADLMQVYQQAVSADPQLYIDHATHLSNQQNAPIARAKLLPNFKANAQYDRQNVSAEEAISPNTSGYGLQLTQPIIHTADWLNYRSAAISAKGESLEYRANVQNLMVRTAQAYFDVLKTQNKLQLSLANRHKLAGDLQQAKLNFDAGIDKRSDMDIAQAEYDASMTDIVAAQNELMENQAKLQEITGVNYPQVAVLKSTIPLISPKPSQLQTWLEDVRLQNLTVIADRAYAHASRVTIDAQHAGHYPTLDANANYTKNYYNTAQLPNPAVRDVGLQVTVPLYSGGSVEAQTRQAAYNYQRALGQLALDYRQEIDQAQTSYSGVVNGIALLVNDRITIASYQRALQSTRLSYHVGLRGTNIHDLLDAENNVYKAQRDYAMDQTDYIMSLLKLKQAAGTLNVSDLVMINGWLAR